MRVIQLHPGFDAADDIVRNLQFRPDGQALVGLIGDVGSGHTLIWYDLLREKVLNLDHIDDDDEAREWSPDPALNPSLELLARITSEDNNDERSANNHDAVRLTDTWAKPPENVVLSWSNRGRSVMALGFSPAGVLFVGGSVLPRAAVIARWDAESIMSGSEPDEAVLLDIPLPGDFLPSAFAFAPNGFELAVGTFNGYTLLTDLRQPVEWNSLRHTPQRTHGQPIHTAHYSPDGRYFVSRSRKSITVWDIETRLQLLHLAPNDTQLITASAFSPDSRTLALASEDGTIALYETDAFMERMRFDWKQGSLHSVAFAPDGLTAAAGAAFGRVILWDL